VFFLDFKIGDTVYKVDRRGLEKAWAIPTSQGRDQYVEVFGGILRVPP